MFYCFMFSLLCYDEVCFVFHCAKLRFYYDNLCIIEVYVVLNNYVLVFYRGVL